MQRTKWTERKFSFDFPEGWMPNILERLRGTSARISALTSALTEDEAAGKSNGKWSLKEHIGHLGDLEDLHEGRIEDLIARKDTLRGADMSNAKTDTAGHDHRSISQLIRDFTEKRNRLVLRFEQLDDTTQRFHAKHPRLQKPMRPIDIAFFTAEHDDHHLATMREILKNTHKT